MMATERGQWSFRERAMETAQAERFDSEGAAQLMARGRWRAQITAKTVACWPSNAACPHKHQCVSPYFSDLFNFNYFSDRVAIINANCHKLCTNL